MTKTKPVKLKFEGTCQCCGRAQRLPNGLLAAHGYKVVGRGCGGWFTGTCAGAHELPLEVSCEAVKRFEKAAQGHADKLEVLADKAVNADTSTGVGWYYEWVKAGHNDYGMYMRGYYRWVADHQYPGSYAPQNAKEANARYAYGQRQEAKNSRDYAARCAEIIRNWKPGQIKQVG